MHKDDKGQIHETGDEARDGEDVRGMTGVLFGSIGLVVVLFLAVWWFFMR